METASMNDDGSRDAHGQSQAGRTDDSPLRNRPSDVVPGIFIMGLGLMTIWLASNISDEFATDELGGAFLPRVLGWLLVVLSGALLVKEALMRRSEARRELPTGDLSIDVGNAQAEVPRSDTSGNLLEATVGDSEDGARRVLVFVGLMVAYTLLLGAVGYVLASVVTFSAMIVVAGERRPLRATGGAAVITGLLYVLFAVIFDIGVPQGIVFSR